MPVVRSRGMGDEVRNPPGLFSFGDTGKYDVGVKSLASRASPVSAWPSDSGEGAYTTAALNARRWMVEKNVSVLPLPGACCAACWAWLWLLAIAMVRLAPLYRAL